MVDNMKIFKKIFWIIIIIVFILNTVEFYRIRNGNEPAFCLSKKEHTYSDGKTLECIGILYKVYEYRRTNLHGTEFVSIFSKEKTPDNNINTNEFNVGELE